MWPVSILKRLRKEKNMDYIKKVINKICKTKDNPETDTVKSKEMNTAHKTFKSFVNSAAALAVCGMLVVSVAAAVDGNSAGADVATSVEEAASDDGSAPGRCLAVQDAETELIQSVETGYDVEKMINEEESQREETAKEEVVASEQQKTTEETEVKQEADTAETEQLVASAEGNADQTVSESEYVMAFSEEDYKVLCTIVEAEAGDQDEKGKILVANVIINRVMDDEFPDNITDVVFQKSQKTYQFSPTRPGGRYYRVTATESTIACVERALKGEDYSEGAMYFAMKTKTDSWFNTSLEFLFKHGDHYFYK